MSTARKSVNMTEGVIWKQLVLFAIPLLIGNIFQQFYNTVDSVVVGQFVGKQALAAVGATATIVNVLVGIFTGLSTGATVVISQCYGARDHERLEKAVHTTVAMTLICGVVFALIGIFYTPFMLRLMATPDDVFPEAVTYLRIYFGGIMSLMLYNMGSGIMRAVGDSRRPLYFLCLSSLLNVALDLLFVIKFQMGVAGVAIATIIAQFVSGILIFVVLARTKEVYRFIPKKTRLDLPIFSHILRIGFPAAIQMSITAFSNVFVMSYINYFGSDCMAGWSAYHRIDQFINLPMQSLGVSATTFAGQNTGAGNTKRVQKGCKTATFLAIGVTLTLTVLLNLACTPILKIFNSDPGMLAYGEYFIRNLTPYFVICAVTFTVAGTMRGAGDTKTATLVLVTSFVVFRQIYLFICKKFFYSLFWAIMAFPFGWGLAATILVIYFRTGRWKNKGIMVQKKADD